MAEHSAEDPSGPTWRSRLVIAVVVIAVGWAIWTRWEAQREQAHDEQVAHETAVLNAKRAIYPQIEALVPQTGTGVVCSDAKAWALWAMSQIHYDTTVLTVGEATDAAYGYTYGAYCELGPPPAP